MKQFPPFRNLRAFNACLLSLLMLTAPFAPLSAATNGAPVLKARTGEQTTNQLTTIEMSQPNHSDDPLAPAVASVTATLTDGIAVGVKKNPGDTITYTAVISTGGASPADDATGVVFTDILDSNTTLVGGSLNAQPIARADAYTASGNIPIALAAPGVLTNDIDPMTGTNAGLTVTEVQGAAANVGIATDTTAVGGGAVKGSVTMATNGSFTYEPPPGYVGNDTFTYKTSEGTLTDTNTVTITISNVVWFIKNTGGGLNRGTFSNPFTTIASFNSANALADAAPNPKSGDLISLRSGTYSEADGINLRNNQKLIGEAIQFSTVFTADANSSTAYGTFAGATAAAPTINATAGNGVDLASSNTVRGLNVGNTSGFDFNGTAVGSPIINTVNVTGTGGAINVSTSGTFGATVSFGTLESSSSTGANINLVGVTGTLGITSGGAGLTGSAASSNAINISGGSVGFTYPGNVTKASLGSLLNVSGGHTGTLVFNTGALQASNGTGLQFDNADGAYSFNASCDLIGGDAGIDIINGSGGTFTFGSAVNIDNPSGIGYREDSSTATVTDSGPITKTNNAANAVDINAKTGGTTTFNGGIVATTTTANAIDLTNTGGTVTFTGGLNLTTTSGVGFNATGSGATVIATQNNGTIVNTITTTTGTALNVANTAIGASGLTFRSISVTGNNTLPTNGIILNGTGTAAGNGGLTITGQSTTAGSGGTIQHTMNSGIKVTSVKSLTLSNMNLTSNAQTQTATNTICGNNLVAADTTPCVANLYLSSVPSGVSLTNLSISGSTQQGIAGTSVTGLTLSNTTINNNGNEDYEDGFIFKNLTGTVSITGTTVRDNFSRQTHIRNDTGSLTLAVSGSRFGRNSAPGVGSQQGMLLEVAGTSTATVDIGTSTIDNSGNGNGLAITVTDTATLGSAAAHSSMHNMTSLTNNAAHIFMSTSGSGTAYFDTLNNTVMTVAGLQSIDYFANGGTLHGAISGNTIGTNNVAQSGCNGNNGCDGMTIDQTGSGALVLSITGNTIQQINTNGIALGSDFSNNLNAVITGNTIRQPSNGAAINAQGNAFLLNVGISSNSVSGSTACVNFTGNTISDTAAKTWDPNGSGTAIYSNTRHNAITRLPGAWGSGTAAATTFLSTNNTFTLIGGAAPVLVQTSTGGTIVSGAACSTPLMFALGGVEASLDWLSAVPDFYLSPIASFPADLPETDTTTLGSSLISSSLTQTQLDSIVSTAIHRWSSTGLTHKQIGTLRTLKFNVANLSGDYLGEAEGNTILVDRSGRGKGWFVDANPLTDASFTNAVSATRRYTDPMNAPAGHVDLLTAIEHEMGHRLGLDDSYAEKDRDSIMYGYLTVGERRLPARGQAENVQSGALKGSHFLSLLTNTHATKRSSVKPASAADDQGLSPLSGETVTVNGSGSGFTIPGGDSVTITFQATVNTTALTARQATTQGTITANGGAINVLTDDPDVAGTQATITLLDTTLTWTGATNTDWNTATNWNRTGPVVSTYAPGVSNPAVNDVIVPAVANQPTIGTSNISVFSLNLANTMTLTITNPFILAIDGGGTGSDLTLDGIISGGNLNFGTGTHVINNAGGTGSLSPTNVATVLSGAVVTLNHNLQAGALAVNAGGSMTIAGKTLSLNGSGAALTVQGGATFTTTTSTVVLNGTAAQTIAGTTYNNLTINNTLGTNVTGVTLTGNATVNGALTLTSSDLDTGAFTLTQPNTTASTGVSDVVGTVSRTGGPFALATALTFGNPNNIITFTAGTTRPTSVTVTMAKSAPSTYLAAVQRNYTISQAGGSNATSTLRLHYLDGELNLNDEATLNLRRLRTSDSHWVAQLPTTRDTTNNWVESNAVLAADLPTQWTFSSLAPTASGGVVTGRIVDSNGAPVEGAVVRLNGTQNRKFITDANGFYRFDNVETSGFYTVTPSRANYEFNPAVRSFSQIGETTEATFSATLTSGGFVNPLDTPEYFVRQHYIDFLGREPDEAGFNFWSDQILECGTDNQCVDRRRENVSAAYFLSIEFQQTGGLVDGLYRASYGVRPQFAQFMPDTRAVGQGVVVGRQGWQELLETNKQAFLDAFVNRPTFTAVYGNMDNSLFVDTLIGHTGVSFTAAERDALVSGLANGTLTRATALRSIAENSGFVNAKFNEAFVMMEYFGYLRRDPDSSGFAFWLSKLNEFNGNFERADMVKAFIVSGEYRDRFPR